MAGDWQTIRFSKTGDRDDFGVTFQLPVPTPPQAGVCFELAGDPHRGRAEFHTRGLRRKDRSGPHDKRCRRAQPPGLPLPHERRCR